MADEIRLHATLSFAKSGKSAFADPGEISIAMSGGDYFQGTQTVGTSEEALLLGDVTPASAYYLIENTDGTNYVELKPGTGGTVTTRIAAGGAILGQFGSSITAPYIQANTAPVIVKILLIEP